MPVNEEGEGVATATVRRKVTRNAPDVDLESESGEIPPPAPAPSARRVYALPQDLVDRIIEFQREKGYQSEVEAARRLLDDALKSRDTVEKIVSRFMSRLRSMRIASEVAKDVLVGHPLISKMEFFSDSIGFEMKDKKWSISISDTGEVRVEKPGKNPFEQPFYSWQTSSEGDKFAPGTIVISSPDDDIPF